MHAFFRRVLSCGADSSSFIFSCYSSRALPPLSPPSGYFPKTSINKSNNRSIKTCTRRKFCAAVPCLALPCPHRRRHNRSAIEHSATAECYLIIANCPNHRIQFSWLMAIHLTCTLSTIPKSAAFVALV